LRNRSREIFVVEDKSKERGRKKGFHIFRNSFALLDLPHNRK
jgi:hypothetical protein